MCGHTFPPLTSCPLSPVERILTITAYCKALLWGEGGYLGSWCRWFEAIDRPKTYLKPLSLCLQTPLVGAAPHKLQIRSSKLRHKLSCPVQGSKELYWSHSLSSHPLACWSLLKHRLIFPCRHIFDNTSIIWAGIASGVKHLVSLNSPAQLSFIQVQCCNLGISWEASSR